MCNRLHLFKICFCCFVDMLLCSNSSSTIATFSALIRLELFPPCFSGSNNFYISQSLVGLDEKNFVFELPEAMVNRW